MTPLLATTDDAAARSDEVGFEWGATLIRVPDVGPVRSRPTAAERWESSWAERIGSRSSGPRPRRRLRREFRVAACLCLAVAPLLTVAGTWAVVHPRSAGAAEVSPAPVIRLSIEPVDREPEAGVRLPGYLLPVERREEPSHEGS